MADKDYYSILGLSEDDKKLKGKEFNDKISKIFRKLSLKWHPDKWVDGTEEEKKTAEEKFKEIAEAYSVLSDEQKREEYDNGGEGFNPFPNGFNPFGPGGPFSRFGGFGGFDPFGMGGAHGASRGPMPMDGSNVLVDVTITMDEAYNGTIKSVRYQREVPCSHCNGTGSEDGKTVNCSHCGGTGQTSQTKRTGNMVFTTYTTCPYCGGTGKKPSKECHVCHGLGTVTTTEEKEIPVPRGVANGTVMGYSGLGNPGKNGGSPGALEVRFTVKSDDYFVRNGDDLYHYVEVSPIDALLGTKVEVKCIDGTTVEFNIPELSKDGYEKVFPGKGMPRLDMYGRNGPNASYHVVLKYKMPSKLTRKQRELLTQLKGVWE
jgi:molecular chaperone DnaJ